MYEKKQGEGAVEMESRVNALESRLSVLENKVVFLEKGHDRVSDDMAALREKLDAVKVSITELQISLQRYLGFGLGALFVFEMLLKLAKF